MNGMSMVKTVLALSLIVVLLALSSTTGQSVTGITPTVTITSVSGYAGHAFVYAEVNTAGIPFPAPTGTTHQSPFYAEWLRQPSPRASCPWIWAVYVFDRATGNQVNLPSANSSTWNFGTSTTLCASPTGTPVDVPPVGDASARLDLDLNVRVTPPVTAAGSPALVSAALGSTLTQDLNLYLNMAIRSWAVTSWSIDFGDGHVGNVDASTGTTVRLTHVYAAAGSYVARVAAFISGDAQAAVYDSYGNVRVINRPFSVAVGNQALASVRPQAIRGYRAPRAAVTVTPSLTGNVPVSTAAGFRHIDALRGSLTTLTIHMDLLQEGQLTIGGQPRGFGHSTLVAWRLDGAASDAPATSGTRPGRVYPAVDPLVLQWNAPDRIERALLQDYVVPVTLFAATLFPDGHLATYAIPSSFSVTVDFAAESG
jgi:PKD repeat protein